MRENADDESRQDVISQSRQQRNQAQRRSPITKCSGLRDFCFFGAKANLGTFHEHNGRYLFCFLTSSGFVNQTIRRPYRFLNIGRSFTSSDTISRSLSALFETSPANIYLHGATAGGYD
jgi:hypothetical protein